MKSSAERILTTHVGSLPRPPALLDLLLAREEGRAVDESDFETRAAEAVDDILRQQIESGIDIVSDGEMSKPSYTMYVRHRLTGIAMTPAAEKKGREIMLGLDQIEHPDFLERMTNFRGIPFPGCVGPVSYRDRKPLERDIAHLAAAVQKHKPVETFMTAPSPGILTRFVVDTYYGDEGAYVAALAEAMKTEYQAIVGAGFLLQIDCPDLGSARHNQYRDKTDAEFIRIAERNVEALNHATEGLPADRMRLHICWGNYEGPHTHDIPLAKVIDVCFKARPQAVSFEGANPRHEHEWEDLKATRIPDDKILIPGVIVSSLNGYYEHLKGNPDEPIAWGVSTYNKFYNWVWLYNGFHAEHHYRPKVHWTKMVELRDSIRDEQRAKGVHVMGWCHALGFMDRQPPAHTAVKPAARAA